MNYVIGGSWAMAISNFLNPTDETEAEDGDEPTVGGEEILHKSI
jgi:hypothetical protein